MTPPPSPAAAPEPGLYEQALAAAAGTPLAAPRPPRPSAAVVPWRRRADGRLEVFWVRRGDGVPFMPGWYAFPGGGVARDDAGLPVAREPRSTGSGVTGTEGPTAALSPIPPGARRERDGAGPDLVPGIAAAALRELWEETGLLLVTSAEGSGRSGATATSAPAPTRPLTLDLQRDAGTTALATALGERGLALDGGQLAFAGRWLTPPFAPLRFDNRFFLLHWPQERPVQPDVVPGELAAGEWVEPTAALARWRSGEALTAPPILHLLTVLAEDGPEAGLPRLRAPLEADLGPLRRIELRPGVVMVPLRTPTLPPATHTNAYLLGTGPAVLVDPGSPWPEEQETLHAALDAAATRLGRGISAVWLTHHHPDHVGGATAAAARFGVPIAAHPETAARLAGRGIHVDLTLADGERHQLGPGLTVHVVHLPGHARGHLGFLVEEDGAFLCGDLLSALSTIVIDPPDGSMAAYLDSLERARDLAPRFLFPAHGPVLRDGGRVLAELIQHRRDREARVLAAWRQGSREPEAIVSLAYEADEIPAPLRPIAARQVVAHLEHLREQGLL